MKIEGKKDREKDILDSEIRKGRCGEGSLSDCADLESGLSLAGSRLTSLWSRPLSTSGVIR